MRFPFRVQAVPLGYDGVSFQVDGVELARYNSGLSVHRPYIFPLIGPSGRMLTRMGHPHDPIGHRHHYSVWIAHHRVNGLDFWSDLEENRQQHIHFLELNDGPESASLLCEILWSSGSRTLLNERRQYSVRYPSAFPPPGRASMHIYWYLDITTSLSPVEGKVTLNTTPFGLLGVRVAKSVCVRDGGGSILNSHGQKNETGTFARPAKWCDYSGFVAEDIREGIAVFDSPQNFGFPPKWHTRDDGWFCPSHFRDSPLTIENTVTFRYRLFIHSGGVGPPAIEEHYNQWTQETADTP